MQKIADNVDAQCPDPLMIIIGGDCDKFECWNLNGTFRGLKLIEFDEIKEVV